MKTTIYNTHNLLITAMLIGMFILAPSAVIAQEEDHNKRIIHQRLLHKFDHNGDGVLTGRESYQARKFYHRWKENQTGAVDRPARSRPDVARPEVRPDTDRVRNFRPLPAQRAPQEFGRNAPVNRNR